MPELTYIVGQYKCRWWVEDNLMLFSSGKVELEGIIIDDILYTLHVNNTRHFDNLVSKWMLKLFEKYTVLYPPPLVVEMMKNIQDELSNRNI